MECVVHPFATAKLTASRFIIALRHRLVLPSLNAAAHAYAAAVVDRMR